MKKVLVIAEAGVNHNGSVELAKRLVDAAADAGADFVKFQTFRADTIVSKTAQKADYQKRTTGTGETQHEMLKRLELSEAGHEALICHCRERGIKFLSTPFDLDSVRYLHSLGLDFAKIPSGEITNLPYLRAVNANGDKVILSTGMSTLDEVAAALAVLKDCEVSLLHCTTEYPCPPDEVNLRAMLTLKERFGLPVGYSDHTQGIEIPIAAVAMGATIIEKHFTLDRSMEGPDHKASLEPGELKEMVAAIRKVEIALGNVDKAPTPSELKNMPIARKSIVARHFMSAGTVLSDEDLAVKRPGAGISPMQWDEILGRRLKVDVTEDEPLSWEKLA